MEHVPKIMALSNKSLVFVNCRSTTTLNVGGLWGNVTRSSPIRSATAKRKNRKLGDKIGVAVKQRGYGYPSAITCNDDSCVTASGPRAWATVGANYDKIREHSFSNNGSCISSFCGICDGRSIILSSSSALAKRFGPGTYPAIAGSRRSNPVDVHAQS
jgi:hypothetical protein